MWTNRDLEICPDAVRFGFRRLGLLDLVIITLTREVLAELVLEALRTASSRCLDSSPAMR